MTATNFAPTWREINANAPVWGATGTEIAATFAVKDLCPNCYKVLQFSVKKTGQIKYL